MSKCTSWCSNAPALASVRNWPDAWSAMISSPRQESNRSQVACRKVRARSYLALRQEAAAPEVLPGERVPGSDDVPGGPAAGQVAQAGELPRHLIRLGESGVDRAGPGEPVTGCGH